MKIVVCGSSSAKEAKVKLKKELQDLGHEVIIHPFYEKLVAGETVDPEYMAYINKNEHFVAKKKYGFIKWYYNKILESDAILVVNLDKGDIKNYIGGNTLMEIAFAHCNDKKVFLLNPIPERLSYTDEIKAMYDEILDRDLTKIPLKSKCNENILSLNEIAEESEKIEREVGLIFDDILNKLTQELGEFNDAVQKFRGKYCRQKSKDNEHVKEELGDLILNISSICKKTDINPNDFNKYALNTLNKFKERKEIYRKNLK